MGRSVTTEMTHDKGLKAVPQLQKLRGDARRNGCALAGWPSPAASCRGTREEAKKQPRKLLERGSPRLRLASPRTCQCVLQCVLLAAMLLLS